MADLRIVDAPVLLQESITDDVKMPTGGLGNFSVRLGDILWYVITKEQLANKSYVDLSSKGVQDSLDEHIADKANPHQVTKVQVGLGNVDNTADIDKPVSNAVSSAIITATNDMATNTYVNSKDGDLTKLTTTDKTNLVKAINEVVSVKADKATKLVGYGITDAYTKSEIDTNYGGVKTLYDKNAAAAGAGANGWTDFLVNNIDNKPLRSVSVEQVDKIADLDALTKLDKRTVIVKSYHTPNYALANPFKGGGTFIYDASKAGINDGVITLNGWVRAISNDVVNPYMGGCLCDGTTDDSMNLQKVLDANANVIDGLGLTCKVNSPITLKPNQTLKNINLIAGTAGMNVVLVNTGSKFLNGKVIGTGTTNIIERAVYPAADGVTDVVIDADISNLTIGVHAQPLTPTANITNDMIPKRWTINGYIHDIVGKVGNSEGYGILLSPAIYCDVTTRFKEVARHALYLSAGASYNNVNINCTDCSFIPVQIYAEQTQRASEFNTIRGNFIGTKKSSAGLSASIAIIGNSHNNDVSTSINSTGCESAIFIEGEGTANKIYPRNNKIHDNAITGDYTSSIIKTVNGENSRIVNNNIYASWSSSAAIFTNVSGTANPTNSGYVNGNSIVGNGGTTNHGIANAVNAPVHVGINDVRNIIGGNYVDYSTNKMRTGRLKQASGLVTTDSIAPGSVGSTTVQLPFSAVNYNVSVTKTSNSSSNYLKSNDNYASISGNTLTIKTANNDTVAQTFTYSWLVLSD